MGSIRVATFLSSTCYKEEGHPLKLSWDKLAAALNRIFDSDCFTNWELSDKWSFTADCMTSWRLMSVTSKMVTAFEPPYTHVLQICSRGAHTVEAILEALSEMCIPETVTVKSTNSMPCDVSWAYVSGTCDLLICSSFSVAAIEHGDVTTIWINLVSVCLGSSGIRDWRILIKNAVPKSLYAPSYEHDVSFWVPDKFDDTLFLRAVCNIAWDLLQSLKLLESYVDSETGRVSRCYRLSYQSLWQPLSWELARDFHLALGTALATVLQVHVRWPFRHRRLNVPMRGHKDVLQQRAECCQCVMNSTRMEKRLMVTGLYSYC